MNSTSTTTPTLARETLYFNKRVVVFVEEKYSFKVFKKHGIKKRTDESDEAFNTRCVVVWNKLCDKSEKSGCIQLEDEEMDDNDEHHDCEAEIEEMVQEAIEEADNE